MSVPLHIAKGCFSATKAELCSCDKRPPGPQSLNYLLPSANSCSGTMVLKGGCWSSSIPITWNLPEMHTLRPYPRPFAGETLGVGPAICTPISTQGILTHSLGWCVQMNGEANHSYSSCLHSHGRTKQVHRQPQVIIMESVRAALGQEKGPVSADPDSEEKFSRMRKDSRREEGQKPRGENSSVVREPKCLQCENALRWRGRGRQEAKMESLVGYVRSLDFTQIQTPDWWLPEGKGGLGEDEEGKGDQIYGDGRRLGFGWWVRSRVYRYHIINCTPEISRMLLTNLPQWV